MEFSYNKKTEKRKVKKKKITFIDTSLLNISDCSLFNNVPHQKPLDSLVLLLLFYFFTNRKKKLIELPQKKKFERLRKWNKNEP